MNHSFELIDADEISPRRELSRNVGSIEDAAVTELSLLVPTSQFRDLACAAEARGVTVGQLVRDCLREALAGLARPTRFQSQHRYD